jgi:3-phosphoshikimate 1-carboxyvinyltransferase
LPGHSKFIVQTIVHINKKNQLSGTVRQLPASKSISNRVLILEALCSSPADIRNISEANDTVLMQRLLRSSDPVLDVEDAGTTMRFLTAYLAAAGQQKVLTGTDRMKLRPIKLLVDALRELGARIDYLEAEGFPPIQLKGMQPAGTASLSIRGDVSSQYISALMMIAPVLPQGLTLYLEGNIGSRPYIEMTASLMKQFGATVHFEANTITIPNQAYTPDTYTVESDWSAASYWYAFAALADQAEIMLPQMTVRSLQGDRVIMDIMEQLGVMTQPRGSNILLMNVPARDTINWDFTHCPDLAQTVAVVCAAKNIRGEFTGLHSLRIKETDRIKALQQELAKLGARLIEEDNRWTLIPAATLPETLEPIETYLDHRMAMAFAPLATQRDLVIINPDVVRKSYPGFWDALRAMGFTVTAS